MINDSLVKLSVIIAFSLKGCNNITLTKRNALWLMVIYLLLFLVIKMTKISVADTLFFKISYRFAAKLRVKYTDFPYVPCPHMCIAPLPTFFSEWYMFCN